MEYEIKGNNLPYVICYLESGESIVSEAGAMAWHSSNMEVETKGRGGIGKMFGRAFSGESMFQNIYTPRSGRGEIAFASSFPGLILAIDLSGGKDLVVQKRAFLASEVGVDTEIFFQKKLGAGFFGGEGFIMQRLYGNGTAFLEVDGSIEERILASGEKIIIDTGYLLAMDSTCSMDIVSAGNMKSMIFGGEGFFNTVINGPGKVYLQTMPLNHLLSLIPTSNS